MVESTDVRCRTSFATAANVGHLVLNHLIPPERDICNDADWQAEAVRSYDGRCSVGHDGMAIEL